MRGLFGIALVLTIAGAIIASAPLASARREVGAGGSVSGFVQQGSVLVPAGEIGASQFGQSVAISTDGATVLVGAPADNPDAPGQNSRARGAVYPFTSSGSSWVAGSKLPGIGSELNVGMSVALSGDGSTALIVPIADWVGGSILSVSAPIRVYQRSGAEWAQIGQIPMPFENGFADQVAMSADGTRVLVVGQNWYGPARDAAWVFVKTSNGWAVEASLPVDTGLGNLGAGAISGDGSTILLGEPKVGNGSVLVFQRTGSKWAQAATLTAPRSAPNTPEGNGFGRSASLSFDGTTAVVGAPGDKGITQLATAHITGAAWVFENRGGTWIAGELVPPATSGLNGLLGNSVSLSADGSLAYAGGYVWLIGAGKWDNALAVWKRSTNGGRHFPSRAWKRKGRICRRSLELRLCPGTVRPS